MAKETIKETIKFTGEELSLINFAYSVQTDEKGGLQPRTSNSVTKDRLHISIDEKVFALTKEIESKDGKKQIHFQDGKVDFTTEEKALLIGYLHELHLNIQQAKTRLSLLDKLN